MPEHPACLSDERLLRDCEEHRGRTSGPGGQHRNKVETAVRLVHRPTGVEGQAGERRELRENHRVALGRLRMNLALTQRGWFELRSMPGGLWRSRTRRPPRGKTDPLGRPALGSLEVSVDHRDYPALLAELLDALELLDGDLGTASRLLGVTATQLVKLLRKEPRALAMVNERRAQRGQRPLK